MIEKESPVRILSDDRLVELLAADGVNIARRTVAKYRECLRIPSSVECRRLKAVSLHGAIIPKGGNVINGAARE